ncbi:sensor histidine kinase [Streptomyces sp. NPDC006487]|uniref:sensor histidine kinase n=1 Tax=Streptomyces sp. NPDC006487 TaxID=3364748 RepID=UPI0036C787F2
METITRLGGDLRSALRRLASDRYEDFDEMPPDGQDALTHVFAVYQGKALRLQAILRLVLSLAAAIEVYFYPHELNDILTLLIICLYVAYSAVLLVLIWRDVPLRAVEWSVPFVDLPVRALLLSISGAYSDPEWSNPFTSGWLLMIVIISAFQLRPIVTATTACIAVVFYFSASLVGHLHAAPNLGLTVGNTITIALVSVSSVLISHIQQSRARSISRLAHRRASMLATTMSLVDRDRRDLAEALHDGPLQSVLSARLDIDEVAQYRQHNALERADVALQDAARQLRSSVTELHPSVLETAGLQQALRDLAQNCAQRGKFTVDVTCETDSAGHDADRLLYSCSRELLTNIVKHAGASHVTVYFGIVGKEAALSVADNGAGLPAEVLHERLSQGHIGLAAQRLRLEEAGGSLTIQGNVPTGTIIQVRVPVRTLAGG